MKQNKNNLLTKLQTWVMLLVATLMFSHTSKADIVYDNSVNRSTNGSGDALVFAQSGYEYGDEVALAGTTARYLTNFAIEYYQNGIPAGATMRLRIYSNDGSAYGTNFNAPGSLLYDSSAFNVGGNTDGFHTLTFNQANSGLAIPVGGSFTWTVEFGGVTSGSAALSLYDAPTVGTDYNQYWEASGSASAPWVYRLGSGGLNVNFGAVASAADKSADTTAPTASDFKITTPGSTVKNIANGLTNFVGEAKDNGGKISLVLVKNYKVASGPSSANFRPAALSSGTLGKTNWSITGIQFGAGTNVFVYKAVDWAGNSTLKSNYYSYTVPQPFTITNLQDGIVSAAAGTVEIKASGISEKNGNSYVTNLAVGRVYSVKLSPKSHSYLSNAIMTVANANVTTISPEFVAQKKDQSFSFTMNTNYGLVVNWATNRYYRDLGTVASGNKKHYGLVGESFVDQANSGNILVQIAPGDKNAFSGELTMNGDVEMPVSGLFDLNGDSVSAPVTGAIGGGVYVVSVHLPFDGSDEISGTVSNTVTSVVSPFTAVRNTWVAGVNDATAYVNRYVLAAPASAQGPTGYAAWAFGIKADGKVDTGDGFLADGNKVKATTAPFLSKNGEWPMFVLDKQSAGQSRKSNGAYTASVIGWMQFDAGVGISGTAKIIRTATDNASANFATGYTNVSTVVGEVWTDKGTSARTIDLGVGGAGTAHLAGGNLATPQNVAVVSQPDGKKITAPLVGGVVPLGFKLEIAHDKGTPSAGGLILPATADVRGVALQNVNAFYGFYSSKSGYPLSVGSISVTP